MFNSTIFTLRIHTHQASMNVGFLSQGSPALLNNLLPEVKEGMDESGYGITFVKLTPFRETKRITCDRRKRQPRHRVQ